jgi:predicted metal-binding protein
MTTLMDDQADRAFFFATLMTEDQAHRCRYSSAGRCSVCGQHRAPERATTVEVKSTDRERLSIEL